MLPEFDNESIDVDKLYECTDDLTEKGAAILTYCEDLLPRIAVVAGRRQIPLQGGIVAVATWPATAEAPDEELSHEDAIHVMRLLYECIIVYVGHLHTLMDCYEEAAAAEEEEAAAKEKAAAEEAAEEAANETADKEDTYDRKPDTNDKDKANDSQETPQWIVRQWARLDVIIPDINKSLELLEAKP